jgi:hypothetical protein
MTRRHNIVRLCPDCCGILQPIDPEALTSSEVAASDTAAHEAVCQCLICGYTDAPERQPAAESA